MVRVEDLSEGNVDDLISICSSKLLEDPVHSVGVSLKRAWLLRMLREYGPCAKLAYYRGRPAAQVLYYPEEADPTVAAGRKGVLVVNCVYNPVAEAQRLGIASMLLEMVVEEARRGISCLRGEPCRFILAKAFTTGLFLSLPEFYRRCGFKPVPGSGGRLFYLPVAGEYEPLPPAGGYRPLPEDRGRALVFYSPVCQFSYSFAVEAARVVREVAPELEVELLNMWESPQEFLKRGGCGLVVNAKPVRSFVMDKEFREEVKRAARGR